MADLKAKDVNKLETWNEKELRKLRMTIKNRISSFQGSGKLKELKDNHPLYDLNVDDCNALLEKVMKAEKVKK
ncbi:MAG: hypothetical protein JNM93_08875 [Bacteriovoracaceae bacterium]|nr:hypothetical protein [Bacteriovoracaceae bacterium]